MAQGNRKVYIGETLVSDKSLEEQNQLIDLLMDHLKASGGEGSKINADLLDGLHATDFATIQQGQKADTALQPNTTIIGDTPIINGYNILSGNAIVLSEDTANILSNSGFSVCDGIKLDGVDECLRCLNIDEESTMSLEDSLRFLRCLLSRNIKKLQESKVDMEYYGPDNKPMVLSEENFSTYYRGLLDSLNELKNFMDGDGLNATSINGIKFRLITQEQYDKLNEDAKLDPFMIYITVDEIPENYVPPNANGEPPSVIDFKIADNKDGDLGIWYKNSYSTDQQWHELTTFKNIFSTFDFNEILEPEDVATIISSFNNQQIEDSVFLAKNPYKEIILNAVQGLRYKNRVIPINENNIIDLPNFAIESELINDDNIDSLRTSINNINRTLTTQNQNIATNTSNINSLTSSLNTKSNVGHTHSIKEITGQKLYIAEIPPSNIFLSLCGYTDKKILLRRIGNVVSLRIYLGYLNPAPQSDQQWGFIEIGKIPRGFRNVTGIFKSFIATDQPRGLYYNLATNVNLSDYINKTNAYYENFSILQFYSDKNLGSSYNFVLDTTYLTYDPFPTESIVKNQYNFATGIGVDRSRITYEEKNLPMEW